jgi:phosphatidylglycerophosphate synthase
MDRDRLRRIRNFQSDDWYPALVIRPLTVAVMLLIADWRFLTPNRLTTVANLTKLAGAALLIPEWLAAAGLPSWPATVAAVVLLQLGILFDHLDGTMARYRGTFTTFGSFYDKASDIITWFAICLAVGWHGYHATGAPLMIVLATSSAAFLAVRGYMRWLLVAESEKLRWHEAAADPAAAIARRTAPPRIGGPPERSAGDWLRWIGKMSVQLYRFEEMDLFFWVGLGLLVGRVDLLCWLLFLSQLVGFVGMTIRRHREAHQVDLALRAARG